MSTATMSRPKRHPLAAAKKNYSSPRCTSADQRGINAAANAISEPEFEIKSPKFAALDVLDELDDDVSWEEIFDLLELCTVLQKSFQSCNDGLFFTHEEVKARLLAS